MRTLLILIFALALGGGRGRCGETPVASPIALPAVGTLGVVPSGAEAIRIQVDADGRIVADGRGPLSLSQLEAEVERQAGDAGWVAEDGSSRKVVVLEADTSLPWATTVWIVDAAFSARPQPQEVYFVARAGKDGARGALGWRLPGEDQTRSAALPWTAAVLDFQDGPGEGPQDLLRVLQDAQQRADVSGETRLEILVPRSGNPGMPTGFVLGVFDLALRAGVTDVVFEGNAALLTRRRQSLEWLLETTAGFRRAQGTPRIRVVGTGIDPAVEGAEPVQAQGVLPHRYGLDVVTDGSRPRTRHRGRPGFYGTASKAGAEALQWLAAQQSDDGSWPGAAPGHEVAATGLALLAFLRHGYTHRGRHAFAKVVARGLRFLKGRQRDDGFFGSSLESGSERARVCGRPSIGTVGGFRKGERARGTSKTWPMDSTRFVPRRPGAWAAPGPCGAGGVRWPPPSWLASTGTARRAASAVPGIRGAARASGEGVSLRQPSRRAALLRTATSS